MSNEVRSGSGACVNLELFPELPGGPAAPPPPPPARRRPGVGARQGDPDPRQGGGGYLDECTSPELSKKTAAAVEPRVAELAEIGLSKIWLDAAALLGYDRFMALWRHLSADRAVLLADGQILLELRTFAAYEKLQRDLYIRRLVSMGMTPSEIKDLVHKHLGDDSTYSAIKKVAAAHWADGRHIEFGQVGLSPYLQERLRRSAHSAERPDMFPDALEREIMAQACKAGPKRAHDGGHDQRLHELVSIGLSASWLAVARLVGYDDFMRLWRGWSALPELRTRFNRIELRLRNVRAFDRYQRNRYIETLVAAGLKPSEIHKMLKTELGENLTLRHLKRLTTAARVLA